MEAFITGFFGTCQPQVVSWHSLHELLNTSLFFTYLILTLIFLYPDYIYSNYLKAKNHYVSRITKYSPKLETAKA